MARLRPAEAGHAKLGSARLSNGTHKTFHIHLYLALPHMDSIQTQYRLSILHAANFEILGTIIGVVGL